MKRGFIDSGFTSPSTNGILIFLFIPVDVIAVLHTIKFSFEFSIEEKLSYNIILVARPDRTIHHYPVHHHVLFLMAVLECKLLTPKLSLKFSI